MKITRLEIADYQQFKDFAIDLTYPAGHPKAGEPLDKICLIGQSGTGKTTILSILKDFLHFFTDNKPDKFANAFGETIIPDKEQPKFKITAKFIKDNLEIYMKKIKGIRFGETDKTQKTSNFHKIKEIIEKISKKYVYLNAELLDKTKDFIVNNQIIPQLYLSDEEIYIKNFQDEQKDLKTKQYFDFSKDNPVDIWKLILSNAQQFMREELKYSKKLSRYILSGDNEAMDKLIVEAKEWRKNTVNPFAELAKRINPILNIFHLEIKANIDFENPEEMQFISIQHKDKFTEKLDYDVWSTGTKQVVMTATPLFALDTKDTVVLFDEPERSLYPDIQRVIIKHYTELAPEAQFFFATHSPLIASQFEPWEIVELKFNEEGKVYRELYYDEEKGNHVDNYTIFPEYLRWDEILTKVFDLNYDGNSDFRIELLTKTVRLKKQLAKMEQEGKRGTPEYNTKMDKFIKDAQKLGWSEELRTFYEKN